MEGRYRELTRRPQSVLVATTISSGCRQRYFKSGIGLEYGVHRHKFESSSHSISAQDEQRLIETITKEADSEPSFWWEYIRRANVAGSRLIDTARSSSALAELPLAQLPLAELALAERRGSHRDLLESFLGLTEAMREMAPFVVATPAVLDVLTSRLAKRLTEEAGESHHLTEEAGESNPEVMVSDLLPRLLTPWYESDPVGDMRNGYRIALEILSNEAAAELFCNTSPKIALGRVEEEFPELHQAIRHHVDEYGWLRTQGYRYHPLSPESLVYRIQLALIRWPMEAIREAAQSRSAPITTPVLGFPPSESLAGHIAAVQAMLTERVFRVDVHLQAECIARPFLGRIADALGCTTEQVLFSSAEEIAAGLACERELPLREIDQRAGNGFTVQREDVAVMVHSDAAPSTNGGAGTAVLAGMTACRGTAVGRVRIVLHQDELLQLEIGDVLVTAASTIDHTALMGETTVFPTRNGGPHADALQKAAAVVADEGGLLSHAAIVCRERGLPCVLGTERATKSLVDGQVVEVDATKPLGIVIPLGPSW